MNRLGALAVFLALLSGAVAEGADISGRVLDFVYKTGIDGATIEAKIPGAPSRVTVSGRDGRFEFTKIPQGKLVQIEVSQLGYSPNPLTRPIMTTIPSVALEVRLIPQKATDQYLQLAAREITANLDHSTDLLDVLAASNMSADQHNVVSAELIRLSEVGDPNTKDPRFGIVVRTAQAQAALARGGVSPTQMEAARAAEAAEAAAEPNRRTAQQLEALKVEVRVELLKQFNAILQTRDTARGLIVNMPDALFDTGKYSLRPEAREKLAKVAGIAAGLPGLRLDVEGHTDSVGGDDYNQLLSERRATAVLDCLMQQGMPVGSVTAKGFGKAQPVASNDTAPGRQQNRRVEIVIYGEVIGTEFGR